MTYLCSIKNCKPLGKLADVDVITELSPFDLFSHSYTAAQKNERSHWSTLMSLRSNKTEKVFIKLRTRL